MKNILDKNLYSIIFKLLGVGCVIIGFATLVLPLRYDNRFVSGLMMFFGLLFVGTGEIINLLQQLVDGKRGSKKSK